MRISYEWSKRCQKTFTKVIDIQVRILLYQMMEGMRDKDFPHVYKKLSLLIRATKRHNTDFDIKLAIYLSWAREFWWGGVFCFAYIGVSIQLHVIICGLYGICPWAASMCSVMTILWHSVSILPFFQTRGVCWFAPSPQGCLVYRYQSQQMGLPVPSKHNAGKRQMMKDLPLLSKGKNSLSQISYICAYKTCIYAFLLFFFFSFWLV